MPCGSATALGPRPAGRPGHSRCGPVDRSEPPFAPSLAGTSRGPLLTRCPRFRCLMTMSFATSRWCVSVRSPHVSQYTVIMVLPRERRACYWLPNRNPRNRLTLAPNVSGVLSSAVRGRKIPALERAPLAEEPSRGIACFEESFGRTPRSTKRLSHDGAVVDRWPNGVVTPHGRLSQDNKRPGRFKRRVSVPSKAMLGRSRGTPDVQFTRVSDISGGPVECGRALIVEGKRIVEGERSVIGGTSA